jgi:glycosyltransferase involved in cell wall biosynthesis
MKTDDAAQQSERTIRVVSNISYGSLVDAVDPTRRSTRRGRLGNVLRLFRATRAADVVFTNESKASPAGLVLLALLLFASRQRKLVLAEFLPGIRTGVRGRMITVAYRALLPRVLVRAQVMTEWEQDDYSARYNIPRERLRVIPFYYFDDRLVPEPVEWDSVHREGYVSTGKNSCDWDTLIAAAAGQNWPLTIICREGERSSISESAAKAGITVRTDLPRDEHDRLLANSAMLIVALRDRSVSAGHVRLMTAATLGVPVIATAVPGIAGYEHLTVATVPPADPTALRRAVQDLIGEPAQLRAAMEKVRVSALTRPYSTYIREIASLVTDEH